MGDYGWHLGEHLWIYAKMSRWTNPRGAFIVAALGLKAALQQALGEYVDCFHRGGIGWLPAPAGSQGVSLVPVLEPLDRARLGYHRPARRDEDRTPCTRQNTRPSGPMAASSSTTPSSIRAIRQLATNPVHAGTLGAGG